MITLQFTRITIWLAVIGFFNGSFLWSGAAAAQCGEQQLKNCMSDLGQIDQDFLMNAQREQFENVCRKLGDVQSCLRRQSCDDNSPAVVGWNLIKRSFEYMCHTGKPAYLDNLNCFKAQETQTQISSCKPSAGQSNACRAVNEQIACVKNRVTRACNQKAGTFMKIFMMHILKPIAASINCKLDEDDNDWDDDGIPDKEGFPMSYNFNPPHVSHAAAAHSTNIIATLVALSLSIYFVLGFTQRA